VQRTCCSPSHVFVVVEGPVLPDGVPAAVADAPAVVARASRPAAVAAVAAVAPVAVVIGQDIFQRSESGLRRPFEVADLLPDGRQDAIELRVLPGGGQQVKLLLGLHLEPQPLMRMEKMSKVIKSFCMK